MIPTRAPSVYRIFNGEGILLYIGATANGASRLDAHRSTAPWWTEVAFVTVEHHDSISAARQAEEAAIRSELPLYNVHANPALLPRDLDYPNSRKTHCPQGHPYDETNTRIYRRRRYCKTCMRERIAAFRARVVA